MSVNDCSDNNPDTIEILSAADEYLKLTDNMDVGYTSIMYYQLRDWVASLSHAGQAGGKEKS